MYIRKEEPKDYAAIYEVVKESFKKAEHVDGNEQDLVNSLRLGSAYIPELAFVAEENAKIIGYIMFTKATIGTNTVLVLAPLSVLPEWQRKGVGKALIEKGHRIARQLRYEYSIVLGSETYYPKFGYVPAKNFGIIPPFDVPEENFMAYKINLNAPPIDGEMKYAPEFGLG